MATVEQESQQLQDAPERIVQQPDGIAVENPATGETVATVPDLSAEQVAEMAARGRAAQPEWEASASRVALESCCRAQKWVMGQRRPCC